MKRWLPAALGILGCACLSIAAEGCGARADLSFPTDPEGSGAGGPGSGAGGGASASNGSATGPGVGGAGPSSGSGAGPGPMTSVGVGPGVGSGAGPGTTSSAGPSGSGSGAGGAAPFCPGFGDACTDCLSEGCPARYCACFENPDCFALTQCVSMCNDDACEEACLIQHGDGISDLYLLTDCAATVCGGACPGNNDIDACSECVFGSCEDESNACLGDADCLDLYTCLSGCDEIDLACQQGCYTAHGDGVPELQAMLECAENACPDAC